MRLCCLPLRVGAESFLRLDKGRWSPVAGHAPRTLARIAAAQARHGSTVLVPYYGSARGGRPITRPVGTITTVDRFAVVRGDEMRMLSVAELRAAMGFPPGYVLTGTRRDQVRQLGNAVCPPVAREVVRQLFGMDALDVAA
ncbi:MAG: DNA cytosine methyltransferase [Deltaproteobacteria bacterium]